MSIWRYEKAQIMSRRILVVMAGLILIALVIWGRLFYLQVLQGERYLLLAERNRLSVRLTHPSRGKIYDRNGVKLAENKKVFQAVLIKEQAPDVQETLRRFMRLVPLDESEQERIQKELQQKRPFMPVQIKENLSFEEMTLLQLNAPDLLGIQIEEGFIRFYPHGPSATHAVGYVSLLTDSDVPLTDALLNLPGYRIGRAGVEASFEDTLKGTPGVRKTEINALGRTVRVLEETPATAGRDITLTLDIRLQKFITETLGQRAASAVVMDVRSGEILALVSTPAFDPNLFTVQLSPKDWNALITNKRRPLQNKALTGIYSPGSLFKLVVALAGLESGDISPRRRINCTGKMALGSHAFHCWKKEGHGPLNLHEAIMQSCDVYFYEMARQIGERKILQTAEKLGFGRPVEMGLKGEKTGLLPTPRWKEERFGDGWRLGDTINLSIGQGFLNATPLQMVYMVAQLVNGGLPVRMSLIRQAETDAGEPPQPLFSAAHLTLVKEGMDDAVNKPEGTGYGARFNYYGQRMGGKTATTQVRRISLKEREDGIRKDDELPEEHRDHAIFVGYAPTDNPKYAAVVLVEHGGGGGRTAAPLASRMLREAVVLEAQDAAAAGEK